MIPIFAIKALAVLAVLSVAGAGGWKARGVVADRDMATLRTSNAQALTAQAQQAQAAEAAQRAIEARRTTALQEIADASHTRTQARAVAVRTAAVAGDGLRFDAATFAAPRSQAGSDPGAACICPADGRAAVLADLLASVEQAGREMARLADKARDAGHDCEASYDAMKGQP